MLQTLGVDSLASLIDVAVPDDIRRPFSHHWSTLNETGVLDYLKQLLKKNKRHRNFIGMGYYGTHLPNVIRRNMLENPGWYTAYTPYQAELSQGRLEMLMNFQQMTLDLTGLEVASASLLDEATAAAEAMRLARRVSKKSLIDAFFMSMNVVIPQTIDVLKTRAFDIDVITGPVSQIAQYDVFGALLAYPSTWGDVRDDRAYIAVLKKNYQAIIAVVSDLMSLVVLKAPGALGADIVLGSAQRFGVSMGFGGPHAAFFCD